MMAFWSAFWRNQRNCKFVEESTGMEGSGVWFFRNLHGVGEPAKDLTSGKKDIVEAKGTKAGMAARRNSVGAKRRLSHGVATTAAAALPLLAE